ncbi:hypothetical protein JHK87_016348 [Glycine soja]|nr:hypothetical protein JHK87_016348 [Glycine soja]
MALDSNRADTSSNANATKDDASDEDLASKQQLELQEIRTSTSSMTSVPKLLKFLRPHYGTLKTYYATMVESNLKV